MKKNNSTTRSVLITGGTGSFGQAMARRLIKDPTIERVVVFSRDEWKQWVMRESDPLFQNPKVRFFLGDVRDIDRLKLAFSEIDTVIHAAALKQVPAAEYNPTEFVKTNVIGAMNVTQAALDTEVKKVICLSTDKAVNPINLYGATKLCSDKLCIAANSYRGKRPYPLFSIVRYGNVLGSRGSLLEVWKNLLAKGAKKLPLTSPEMTRFWITIEQTVTFVLHCLKHQVGGEIFVPKIPSVYITDLAKALYPNLSLDIVGIRPGEKVHEVLISKDDAAHVLEWNDHYRIIPSFSWQKKGGVFEKIGGKKVQADFALTSHTNPLLERNIAKIKNFVREH